MGIVGREGKQLTILERHLLRICIVMLPVFCGLFRQVTLAITLKQAPGRCVLTEVSVDDLPHVLPTFLRVVHIIDNDPIGIFGSTMEGGYLVRIDPLL